MSHAFRYFARRHDFAAYTAEPTACAFCGEVRYCYSGSFSGGSDDTDDLETICEECLVRGRLTAAQLSDNEGSLGELRRQLTHMRPDLAEAEIERIAHERTDELESRTPSPLTWQDFH